MDRETIVRFVRDECAGDTKAAAERMGISVSYILRTAPELRTPAQVAFDDKANRYGDWLNRTRFRPDETR